MDKQYPPEAWRRLGKALEARRAALGYGFRQRERFLADNGGPPPSAKMLARLERGERASYPDSTIARLESLYGYAPGSFEALLADGEGTPLPGTPGAAPLRPVPSGALVTAGSPAAEILADLLARYPGDRVVQALGDQTAKAPRMIVSEILEWLDYQRDQREGRPEAGGSAGLTKDDPKE